MISVFDSGIGGISILKEVRALLPEAPILYFGDTAYMPYGSRTPQEIYQRIKWFIKTYDDQTDLYVIACNTATVSMIDDYRKLSTKPFVGVEPGIKPAVGASKSKHIAVLATPRTIASPQIGNLIKQYGEGCTFELISCDGLAEAIERKPSEIEVILKSCIQKIPAEVDTVILACTHYPLIIDQIRSYLPPHITIVDVSPAVARRAADLYTKLEQKIPGKPEIQFICSGEYAPFIERIQTVSNLVS